jgi:hypothetical protein
MVRGKVTLTVREMERRNHSVDGTLHGSVSGAALSRRAALRLLQTLDDCLKHPSDAIQAGAVRAPGKTGLPPDGVKPRTYLGFTTFSIALFEALLEGTDWALPGDPAAPPNARVVTESFPTAGWRALGLSPLMAKGRASVADVQDAGARLQARTGITLEQVRTHDQLQAAVGGIAGAWWAAGRTERVQLAGVPPFRLDGSWREGYIMIPATTT